MKQPVPSKHKDKVHNTFNTLLIDGSNLLEVSSRGDDRLSGTGKPTGGIFQFFLQLKMLLRKGNFRYVYVFWDGKQSGLLRYKLNSDYKANRDKEFEDEEELSDYMKAVNAKINGMKQYFSKKEEAAKLAQRKKQKEIFHWQREVIIDCLEELFVRQCMCDKTEADDFIGYYVTHKKSNERIVICSNDRDLTQLIAEDVIVYVQSLKDFLTVKNYTKIEGINYQNVVLKKVLCGDTSDNIKGIKGFGEKTLLNNFDEITKRKVTLNEVIEKAKNINEERAKLKKKPLKWAENIVNRVTDGVQGSEIYEINEKIIDLKKPLMTDEAVEMIENIMYTPIDPEDRTLENLYRILLENDVEDLRDETKFSNFFNEFLYLIDKEKRNLTV